LCNANAALIASGAVSHSRVDPSTSVNKNVTVPDGGKEPTNPKARFARGVPLRPCDRFVTARLGQPRGGLMFQTIVVGTDGSPTAKIAVSQAVTLAKADGATLHIVSTSRAPAVAAESRPGWAVVTIDRLDVVLDEAAALARISGINVEIHGRRSDPAAAIVQIADDVGADLVVVGNKGMKGTKRFILGSVPNKVAHSAHCAVLIVKTT
jgi:nucleotide-binding universal stress UspA family protein